MTGVLIAAAMFCAMGETSRADVQVIARVNGRPILRSEVACSSDTSVEQCQKVEQANFDSSAALLLIDAAADFAGIHVSADEIAKSVPELPTAQLERAGERLKLLARAALKVRQGADRDAVFEHDLRLQAVTQAEFESVLRAYSTAASAQRAIDLDFVAESRRQLAAEARRRIIVLRLREFVGQRATDEHLTVSAAQERFWADVIRASHSVVLDPAMHLPNMEGVINGSRR